MNDKDVRKLILDPSQEIAWASRCILRGFTFKKREDGWLMVVKVTDRKSVPKVAFIHAPTVYDCWHLLASAMYTKGLNLKWKDDKFV